MIGEHNQWKICFDIFTDTMGGQFGGEGWDEPNSILCTKAVGANYNSIILS